MAAIYECDIDMDNIIYVYNNKNCGNICIRF
jgi:hypothetical protein